MTLLELLVAMTLLSFVALVMFGGLKFGTRVWDRSIRFADDSESIQASQRLLREQLSVIYPEWRADGSEPGHVRFEGAAERLVFVAPPPPQLAPGPNDLYELSLTAEGSLELRWQAAHPIENEEPSKAALLRGVKSLQFSYYGDDPAGLNRQWWDSWSNRKELPLLIRIRLGFAPGDRRTWPELVVHPRIMVDTSCVYDPVNFGCRGR